MKDFDSIQSTVMRSQGILKLEIPKDLLEAFGHDPSAVTGPTRRDRGWRAVEDINQRVEKQRSVFRAFIQSFIDHEVNQGCVLDEPIDNIIEALESLQLHKTEIEREAESVSGVLESVQNVHTGVKENYNSTVSHVSIVYPEVSFYWPLCCFLSLTIYHSSPTLSLWKRVIKTNINRFGNWAWTH